MPDKKTKKASSTKKAVAAKKPAAPKKVAPKKVAPKKAEPKKAEPKKAAAPKTAAPKPAAPKAPAPAAAAKKPTAGKPAAKKPAAKVPAAKKPAAPRTRKATAAKKAPRARGANAEGFLVARVAGEDAVRDAPRSMLEAPSEEEALSPAEEDEGLGELPWTYGDDTLVALPRDPRTLFLYWDHAQATLSGAFGGLDHPRAQLWLYALGAGWERVRVIDFALEARGYYLHDLEPGRTYRAEIHLVDRRGHERLLPAGSNPVALPPAGASPVVDDRFVRIPWDLPLPSLLGAGTPGGPFSEALRALLAQRSDWASYQGAGAPHGVPGGPVQRPSSPPGGGGPSGRPSSPSSPFGPLGGEGR